jgi:hypothetical protein
MREDKSEKENGLSEKAGLFLAKPKADPQT